MLGSLSLSLKTQNKREGANGKMMTLAAPNGNGPALQTDRRGPDCAKRLNEADERKTRASQWACLVLFVGGLSRCTLPEPRFRVDI